ncbi:DUF4411 family protein [Ralstonia pseudosolanacearum]|uniref:DUF4411 family protein n=1 Tax=Ralstonia pseudosolanacearum TaxID=1310165 RepID=UPI0009E38FB0|nr:DUF4411 family protein [Ralstonia pseudosolanacearum]
MRVFDASSIIYAWDNYPIDQFPKLWGWLGECAKNTELAIPRVAFDEVGHVAEECWDWLRDSGVHKIEATNAILQEALSIKKLLGINNDLYGSGVDENDLIIIATAKSIKRELVSDEARQKDLPKLWKNCKIPAVCGMGGVGLKCINFLDLLKLSGRVFG